MKRIGALVLVLGVVASGCNAKKDGTDVPSAQVTAPPPPPPPTGTVLVPHLRGHAAHLLANRQGGRRQRRHRAHRGGGSRPRLLREHARPSRRAWAPASSSTRTARILTNNHVIEGAATISVTLPDDRELPARVVGRDSRRTSPSSRSTGPTCRPLPLGDSDNLDVGDWVIAIGNPFGLSHTRSPPASSARRAARRTTPRSQRLLRFHPDRCRDQPRQLRRSARQLNTAR